MTRSPDSPGKDLASRQNTTLRMQFVEANVGVSIKGQGSLSSHVNYFRGKDPKLWRRDVPTYQRVKYEEIYPGIDLIYYGQQQQLEYDFVVAPKADPKRITIGFSGAERLEVNHQGDLVVNLGGEQVHMHRPVAYQTIADTRKEIPARYVLRPENRLGFELAAYDVNHPVTIDPVLEYSTYLGGSGFESDSRIAVDKYGNAYVAGYTESTDFPVGQGLQPHCARSPEGSR